MATATLVAGGTFGAFGIGGNVMVALGIAVATPWIAAVVLGAAVWWRGDGRSPEFWAHGVAVVGPATVVGFLASALAGGGSLAVPQPGSACGLDNAWCAASAGTVIGTAVAWLSFGIAFPALIAPAAACVSALRARPDRPVPRWQICAAIAVAATGFFITVILGSALGLA